MTRKAWRRYDIKLHLFNHLNLLAQGVKPEQKKQTSTSTSVWSGWIVHDRSRHMKITLYVRFRSAWVSISIELPKVLESLVWTVSGIGWARKSCLCQLALVSYLTIPYCAEWSCSVLICSTMANHRPDWVRTFAPSNLHLRGIDQDLPHNRNFCQALIRLGMDTWPSSPTPPIVQSFWQDMPKSILNAQDYNLGCLKPFLNYNIYEWFLPYSL